MEDLIFEVKNLSYSYDGKTDVLKNLSLGIRKGEKIAVLGANGAGKSTFFLNMNGVYTQNRGEFFLHGEKITRKNRNRLRKSVGIVFQEADSQIVCSTVESDVAFGPVNLRLPPEEIKKRTGEAVRVMGMEQYKDRPPHYLSGGEKKRTAIAGVLAMEPEIILFDEPASSLDPQNVRMLEHVLGRLEREEKAVLLSTHDVDFAYRWAARIIVLCGGQIIADNTPERVFSDEEVLERANLARPLLMQVCEIIMEGKKTGATFPKNVEEFKGWFQDVYEKKDRAYNA